MITLHVHPEGSDDWNGLLPTANAERTDGPLASLEGARQRAAALRDQNAAFGVIRVEVQPGRYPLRRPLQLGTGDHDLHFIGVGEGRAVLDGSVRVDQWSESMLHGRRCWRADLSAHLELWPLPRSLFSGGQRRFRSRHPKTGWLEIADVPDQGEPSDLFEGRARFVVRDGDFDPAWRNPTAIEAVINHLWIEERMPVGAYDPSRRLITSPRRSVFTLKNQAWMGHKPCARYVWENVFEALSEPGEWYVDPSERVLYYLPTDEESLATADIRIPILLQLVRIHGTRGGEPARGIFLENLDFFGSDWTHSEGWGKWWDPARPANKWQPRDSFAHFDGRITGNSGGGFAAVPQGAHDLPGAVSFEDAADCRLSDCGFRGLGFYAVDVRENCQAISVDGCVFEDNGAGGVKIEGSASDPARYSHHIRVSDCTLRRNGQIFRSACGIFLLYAQRCLIEHNEVCEQPYTGISVGWCWHFHESPTREIQILRNHIHHLGGGDLSDMGGIYTLGVQPGTLIEGNHIHHIAGEHYGGWGLYLDEGSSFISVRANLVHHTRSQCLHEHWGRQNRYTDNVLAHSDSNLVMFSQEERDNWLAYPPRGAEFLRNILISSGRPFFVDFMRYLDTGILRSDGNLFWADAPSLPPIWERKPWPGIGGHEETLDLAAIKARGMEIHSLTANLGWDPTHPDHLSDPSRILVREGLILGDWSSCGVRPPTLRGIRFRPSFKPKDSNQGFVD